MVLRDVGILVPVEPRSPGGPAPAKKSGDRGARRRSSQAPQEPDEPTEGNLPNQSGGDSAGGGEIKFPLTEDGSGN